MIEAEAENSSARACTFTTLHNRVETPVFMPVATLAVLRDQNTSAVNEMGFPVLLANTYHLVIRPGTEVLDRFGGIQKFMNWPRSVLTDSGGFQVYSLPGSVKITEEGAAFRSYLDGRIIMLSPETSIGAQRIIGSDIMMAMDQCVPSTSDRKTTFDAMNITARWAERSLAARGNSQQSLFGIVQGACFEDLRKISAEQITSLPFDGFAIGGLAVGETADQRQDMTELAASLLPRNYPRYLMGVGTPIDLLEAVHRGVDMFDCILPTSSGQQGVAYTSHGRIELRRGVYKFSDRPLDENCSCETCRKYSRAYLHHLVKSGEFCASNLIGTHNLTFYRNLMNNMRQHIIAGTFRSFYDENRQRLILKDEDNPVIKPKQKQKKVLPFNEQYRAILTEEGVHVVHKSSGRIISADNFPEIKNVSAHIKNSSEKHYVIWDLGLGTGVNTMSVVREYESLSAMNKTLPKLEIISFADDTAAFEFTAANPEVFRHVRHNAPSSIVKNRRWESADYPVKWTVKSGNINEAVEESPCPDLVFVDPNPDITLNTDYNNLMEIIKTRLKDKTLII